MVSRDLTCNESMPPLDDGDNMIDVRRIRAAQTSRFELSLPHQQPIHPVMLDGNIIGNHPGAKAIASADLAAARHGNANLTVLDHTPTVRDVVTKQIRNYKLGNDSQFAFPKFGLLARLDANAALGTRQEQQFHHGHAPIVLDSATTQIVLNSHGHGLQQPGSGPSANGTTSMLITGARQQQPMVVPNHHHQHLLPAGSIVLTAGHPGTTIISGIQTIPQRQQHFVKLKTIASPGNAAAGAMLSSPSSAFHQQIAGPSGVVPLEHQQPATFLPSASGQWALQQPGTQHQLIVQQQSAFPQQSVPSHQKQQHLPATIKSKSSKVKKTNPSSYPVVLPPQQQTAEEREPTTAAASNQQQGGGGGRLTPHSSPRPSILRGNIAAAKRLTDRPASASGLCSGAEVAFYNGAIPTSSSRNCQSRGEDSFANEMESPRKRQRKQYFGDVAHQQDKLRMEVYADPRLDQQSTLDGGKDQTAFKATISQSKNSSNIEIPIPGTTAKTSSGEQKRPKGRRGRPKIADKATMSAGAANHLCSSSDGCHLPSQNDQHQQLLIAQDQAAEFLEGSNSATMTTVCRAAKDSVQTGTPRPVMVEVDSILQEPALKKRKYRKRTPELDPVTGEVVKKVRKKSTAANGRKSKREMMMAEQQQRESAILAGMGFPLVTSGIGGHFPAVGPSTSAHFAQQLSATDPNATFVETQDTAEISRMAPSSSNACSNVGAEEQDVVNTLCRFRRDSELAKANSNQQEWNGQHKSAPALVNNASAVSEADDICPASTSNAFREPNSGSKSVQLPLLTNLSELVALRPLLRRCEKGLNSTDCSHLTESFEELDNFLRANRSLWDHSAADFEGCQSSSHSTLSAIFPTTAEAVDEETFNRICARTTCPVFSSYEQFKVSVDGLRLLPQACAYFDASQRLLKSLRTILVGHSMFQTLNADLRKCTRENKVAEEGPKSKLSPMAELKLAEDNSSEADSRQLFRHLLSQFVNNPKLREANRAANKAEDGADRRLLFQLDVAQTMDQLLDRVDRKSTTISQEFDKFSFSTEKYDESNLAGLSGESNSLSDGNLLAKPIRRGEEALERLADKLPEQLERLLWPAQNKRRKRKRKRKRREEEDEAKDELLMDGEDEEETGDEEGEMGDCANERLQSAGERRKRVFERLLEKFTQIGDRAKSDLDQLRATAGRAFSLLANGRDGGGRNQRSQLSREDSLQQDEMTRAAAVGEEGCSWTIVDGGGGTAAAAHQQQSRRLRRHQRPSRQFAFRPPSQPVRELFKNILFLAQPKERELDQPTTNGGANQSSRQTTKGTKTPKKKRDKDNNNVETTEVAENEQQFLALEDLDQLLDNTANISALSLAQLQYLYPQRFVPDTKREKKFGHSSSFSPSISCISNPVANNNKLDRNPSHLIESNTNELPVDNVRVPFKGTLRFVLNSNASSEERRHFLEARMNEFREIYATTETMMQQRTSLAKECTSSIRNRKSDLLEEEWTTKAGSRQREAEENGDHPIVAIPPKRAAHQRALNNIVGNNNGGNSRPGSNSRGRSAEAEAGN